MAGTIQIQSSNSLIEFTLMNFRIFSRPELLQEFFSIRKYILSFFLLIENYYSFASAEAILATFSFYDSKRSIGFMVFSCFSRPFDLGHFHWRRFIGGRDFVLKIIQTLFTDHSHIHLQLKKFSEKVIKYHYEEV